MYRYYITSSLKNGKNHLTLLNQFDFFFCQLWKKKYSLYLFLHLLQHNSREMLQEEDKRLSHWAESREEHSLPGPGLHPVHWWEDKGAGLVPSCQPTPHQQRPAGVHSQILTHLTKTDIKFEFISCTFFSREYYIPVDEKGKKDQ